MAVDNEAFTRGVQEARKDAASMEAGVESLKQLLELSGFIPESESWRAGYIIELRDLIQKAEA